MGDFLTELAARIGPAPDVVRPRLPSLFEPARGEAAVEASAGVDTERDPQQPDRTRGADARGPDGDRDAVIAADRAARPPANPSARADEGAPMPEPPRRARAALASDEVVSQPPRPTRADDGVAPADASPPSAPRNSDMPAVPAARRTVTRDEAIASPAPPVSTDAEELGRGRAPAFEPVGAARAPAFRLAPPPVREMTPRRPDAGGMAPFGRAPDAEPVIHVTIGRVEVRAVAPPAAARREPSAPAVMGLDEYLRRRVKRGDA